MSSKKRRAEFNKQWRKDRKILKPVYQPSAVFDPVEIQRIADKYQIDFPRERVK